jgi:hypothetical protein
MGKRSNFERRERDAYFTPYDAAVPLIRHLRKCTFIEPCAGDGRLIRHLEKHGNRCVYACDIEPMAEGIIRRDILFFNNEPYPEADFFISNPPWEREVLHRMIDILTKHAPTWFLFQSDWAFTAQALPYRKMLKKIISVGRVSWMENGTSGMENCCWYLFDKNFKGKTQFYMK